MSDKRIYKFDSSIVGIVVGTGFIPLGILGIIPKGMGTLLVLMLMMMPDYGALMLIGGILGIIIGLAWPLLTASALRLREKSNRLTGPVDTMVSLTGE